MAKYFTQRHTSLSLFARNNNPHVSQND
ncbi:MAG: hypothetical protein Dbin4_03061, partial [Alphaproteobacteria bacterium]|nr:hypothetical protein [Alphaproteobacteria bacterium]